VHLWDSAMESDAGGERGVARKEVPRMSEVRALEEEFGGWWCGVKFGGETGETSRRAPRPMRFCEAVAASRTGPISVTRRLLNCSLDWNDEDEAIAQAMAEKAGLEIEVAREVLRATPRLNDRIDEVIFGIYEAPDIVLSYAQPEAAMKVLREWQRTHGRPLGLETSGYMSVCGAVAVKTYLTGRICISFGCPDAREHGGIARDRLVIGVPIREAKNLARNLRAAATETVPTAPPTDVA
jgi:uncharacterized protein (DUF169 family)